MLLVLLHMGTSIQPAWGRPAPMGDSDVVVPAAQPEAAAVKPSLVPSVDSSAIPANTSRTLMSGLQLPNIESTFRLSESDDSWQYPTISVKGADSVCATGWTGCRGSAGADGQNLIMKIELTGGYYVDWIRVTWRLEFQYGERRNDNFRTLTLAPFDGEVSGHPPKPLTSCCE